MRRRSVPVLAAVLTFALLPSSGRASTSVVDHVLVAGTILPPGTDYAHATSEIAPYDNLVYDFESLTDDTLFRYFKDARFGPQGTIARDYAPRAGVRILRDERWGVPHIYGQTDPDVWFGAGYASAEDRLPIMDLLRALGRGEAFELLGTVPAWFADAEWNRLYGYNEEEFQEQIARLPKLYGAEGEEIVRSFAEFVDGINTYVAQISRGEVALPTGYSEIGRMPAPWRETDIVAVTTVIRALFGANGGSELNNAVLLGGLQNDFGASQGLAMYEDFRNRDNRDGPVHTANEFAYMIPDREAIDPAANVRAAYSSGKPGIQQTLENVAANDGQYSSMADLTELAASAKIRWDRLVLDTPLGSLDLRPKGMSNALVVGKDRSANGRPILLGGPQTGYFSPEILLEVDLHGPTISARGAAFPGISMFVLLGRSTDASWTATAGGSDMIDTFIEVLCEPQGGAATEHSYGYRWNGRCMPMERRVHRTLPHVPSSGGFRALPDIYVERTVHGTVMARGTIDDQPVAVVHARSSYMREVDSAISFLRLNRNEVQSGEDFVRVMRDVNLTTNWMYAGKDDIAYHHGGLFPIRPAAVDPDLPVWGTGEWDWQGLMDPAQHPHEVNPAKGSLTSWNNHPAPGWGSSDGNYAWSSLYRADMLDDRIAQDTSITPVELVQMMESAGVTDFRASHVLPLALEILDSASGLGAREQKMITLLDAWLADGPYRRDADQNGDYEHGAAIAIMDGWWSRLITGMYNPTLGDVGRIPLGFDNAPNSGGSAYQNGFYGQVWTDLSGVLARPLHSPTSRIYCGGTATTSGDLSGCAASLAASLTATGAALSSSQGADPQAWTVDAEAERISFLPGVALTMHWVNRPTFQQLTQFGG